LSLKKVTKCQELSEKVINFINGISISVLDMDLLIPDPYSSFTLKTDPDPDPGPGF
jgi:hypothetical protein